MIGYITLGTNNIERAGEFYDTLLEEFNAKRLYETERLISWGVARDKTVLCVIKPFDRAEATTGNGVMIALNVGTADVVDRIYVKALSLGAIDEGKPGPRGDTSFYGGYFRDLDGNKLNVHCFS